MRLLRALALLLCLASPAGATSLTLVHQPTGAWIQHSEAYLVSQFLYGAANPGTDNFYLIQWRHTLGDLPPWKPTACVYGTAPCARTAHVAANGSVDFIADQFVNSNGYPTWRLAISSMQMPCLSGGTPNEVDGGLHSLNGSYTSYPQSDDGSRALLSLYTALRWKWSAVLDDYRILPTLVCAVNKTGSSVQLIFSNATTSPPQTFYYNLRLRCDPAACTDPHWSTTGPSYWQYDDSLSTYGIATPGFGTPVSFDQNVWAQVSALIQSGTGGLDSNLAHWYFSSSSYGEAAWGATSITTEYSFPADPLVATMP